jgi:hypothetical protein
MGLAYVPCWSTLERAEGDVDRIAIAQGAAGSRRGIPGPRVRFADRSEELIPDAQEEELLGGHAAAVLEAGGRGAGEQSGLLARSAMGGYHGSAQERPLYRVLEGEIAAELELL